MLIAFVISLLENKKTPLFVTVKTQFKVISSQTNKLHRILTSWQQPLKGTKQLDQYNVNLLEGEKVLSFWFKMNLALWGGGLSALQQN